MRQPFCSRMKRRVAVGRDKKCHGNKSPTKKTQGGGPENTGVRYPVDFSSIPFPFSTHPLLPIPLFPPIPFIFSNNIFKKIFYWSIVSSTQQSELITHIHITTLF